MAGEDVSVKIGGDATGAKEALSSVSSALDGFKGAMQGLAGAFAFDKIAAGFQSILAESSKADQESRRFINTMQGVGTASDPAKFFALADSLEKVTTFEAEESLAAGSMLARFKLTQGQMETMLPLVQDLAAYMGKDLAGAADDVGKAVELGSVGLRGLNLGFDKAAKAAFDMADKDERVAMIMARMQQQVGGFAQVVASTAVGSLKQFDIALGNVKEAFGGVIDAPIAASMQSLTGYVRDATDWFNGLSDGTKNLLGGLAAGVAVIGGVSAALLSVAGAAGALVAFWPAITGGLAAIGTAGVAAFSSVLAPLSAMVAGVVGVILIVGALRQAWTGDLGGMRSFVLGWVRDVKYLWVEFVGFLRNSWTGFANAFREKFITIKGLLTGMSAEDVGAQLRDVNKTDAADNFSANIEDAFAAGARFVESGSSALSSVWEDAKGIFAEGIAGFKDVFAMLGVNVDAFSAHTTKALQNTLGTAGSKGDGAADAAAPAGYDFLGETGDLGASLDSYLQNAEAEIGSTFDDIAYGLETFGRSLINNIGPLGGMIKNAMTAGATGGPFAAIGSVMADMLTQSESFQNMIAYVTEALTGLAQNLSPLIDSVKPVVDIALYLAQQIGGIVGNVATQIAPLIQQIGDMIAQILTALNPVIETIGGIVGNILTAIMPIVMMIMPVVQMIADVLSALAPALELMLIPLQIWASVMQAAKPIFDLFFQAIKWLMVGVMFIVKALASVYNAILEGVASIVGLIPGLGDVAKNIRKAKLDMQQYDISIDSMKTSTNKATTALDKFPPPLEKATQAASNVPAILKVTRLRLESALADGVPSFNNASASAAARQATGVALSAVQNSNQTRNDVNNRQVFIDSLTVNGKPSDVWDPIKRAMEAERYRLSGSTEASPYPNATPRVVGAH